MGSIRILFKDGDTFITEGKLLYAGDGTVQYIGRLGKIRTAHGVERVWQGRAI